MTTLLREKTVTARKAHACATCNQPAARPGDTYRRTTYVYDGHIYDWVQCTPCREMAHEIFDWAAFPDEGVGFDDYADWASEHAIHGTPDQQVKAKNYLERLG